MVFIRDGKACYVRSPEDAAQGGLGGDSPP
jgi:hypothetical protein